MHSSLVVERAKPGEPCASCGARPISVCSAVDDRDLARLTAVIVRSEAAAGETLLCEGDPADSFVNVTSGTVRLFKSLPDGRRQITGFAGAGHFLGLAASTRFGFSAEAVVPVRFCRFSRRKLGTLMDDVPAFERKLLETARGELVAAQEQMLLLGRKTARERVASFLLAMSRDTPACTPPLSRIHLPMPRGDIADYLGLTVETVSRTLTQMKNDKLIAMPAVVDITILDHAALAAAAGEIAW